MARSFFTITTSHVARQRDGIHGASEQGARIIQEARQAREALGILQPHDVLKRCYIADGVAQCENDGQRAARLAAQLMDDAWRFEAETMTVRTAPGNHMVADLGRADAARDAIRNGEAIARVPDMLRALRSAIDFVAGFEGDDMQEGIDGPDGLLAILRKAAGPEA